MVHAKRGERLGARARNGLPLAGRLAIDAAGYAVGGAFAAASALRGGKAVHPDGVVHAAQLVVDGTPNAPSGSQLLSEPARRPALVRVSRSLGLPRPLPDLLGLSIRIPDAYGPGRHQDLLLVSSADLPVVHHVFLPSADVQQRPYSSSLPYRAGSRRFLIGALPLASSPRPDGADEFDRLARAAATGELALALAVAPLGGRFERVGELRFGERLPPAVDALRFSPFNTGGGLEPAGLLNRLRDYAYPLSQRGWARGGGALAQQRAEEQQVRGRTARAPVNGSGDPAAALLR